MTSSRNTTPLLTLEQMYRVLLYMTRNDRRYGANLHTFVAMPMAKREKWATYVHNNPHLPLSQAVLDTALLLRLKGQL